MHFELRIIFPQSVRDRLGRDSSKDFSFASSSVVET